MHPRLPPHSDEPARTIAVLEIVAREVKRGLRGPLGRSDAATPAMLAERAERAGWGGEQPLSEIVEQELAAALSPVAAKTGAAADPTPTAAPIPDFSPEFLLLVKHSPPCEPFASVIRRDACAEILGVSLDWFDRTHASLTVAYGFPSPRDATGQKRWDRAAVTAWSRSKVAEKLCARARAAHAKATARRA